MTTGIYGIKNLVNGKQYIGSSTNIEKRFWEHLSALRWNRHHSRKLQRAWSKYGREAFAFDTLEVVAGADDLLKREQFWIDLHLSATRAGYNISPCASNSCGIKRSAETRRRISASKRNPSAETRLRLSVSHLGYKPTPQARANQSAAMLGRKFSEETRRKIADAHRGRKRGPMSESQRALRSKMMMGKIWTQEQIAKSSESRRLKRVTKPPTEPQGRAKPGRAYQN